MARADDVRAGIAEQLLHGFGKVPNGGGGALLHKQVAGVGVPERKGHKVHGFVQAHQEAGHLRVGDGDGLARFDLVDKQGDNAAAAGHDVAVAGAADGGSLGLDGARLRADNFFHHCLADSHGIDGVRRFIGGETDDLFYARVDGGCQYVVGAQHVGAHGLHGKKLAARHLLERGRMEDIVHAAHHAAQAVRIAHVADIKFDLAAQLRIFELVIVAHIVLLFFVAGKDADLADVCG